MKNESNGALSKLSDFISKLTDANHTLLANYHHSEKRIVCEFCTKTCDKTHASNCSFSLVSASGRTQTYFETGFSKGVVYSPKKGEIFETETKIFPLVEREAPPFNTIILELSGNRDFGESEISLMHIAAYFAIDALERDANNLRMIEKLNLLSHASNGLLKQVEHTQLTRKLDDIVKTAALALDAELCTLWRVRNGSVAIETSYSQSGKVLASESEFSPIAPTPEDGITGYIVNELAEKKAPVYINKKQLDKLKRERSRKYLKPVDFTKSADTYCELASPILDDGGRLVGALLAYNKLNAEGEPIQGCGFDEKLDGPLVKILCSKIHIALQNADQVRDLNSYKLIIESTPDPVIISDRTGRITYINPGAFNIFGDLKGKNVLTQYVDKDGQINETEARDVRRNLLNSPKKRLTDYETHFKSISGEIIPISLSVSLLHDENGDEAGTIGIAKDLRRFKALSDVSQSLLETHEADEILESITVFSRELLNCKRAYIKTYKERDNTLAFREISSEISGEKLPVLSTPVAAGMTGYAFENNQSVMAGNLSKEPLYDYDPVFPNVESKLAAPIACEDGTTGEIRRLGVISVDSEEIDAFTSSDLAFLRTLASSAAIALKNAETIQTQQKSIARLAAFDRVQQATLQEQPDQDQIYDALLDAAVDTLGFGYAVVATVDRKKQIIKSVKGRNIPHDFLESPAHHLNSKDIQAWVVRNKESEYLDGWDERLDKEIYEKYDHENLVRIFIPIIARGEVLGTLEAGYQKADKQRIEETEIHTLNQLVNLAASGMAHIILLTKLKEDLALRTSLENQLETLNQAILKIMDAQNEQEAAKIIFSNLEKIGYKKGLLSLINDGTGKLEGKYANGKNWGRLKSRLSYGLSGKNILAQALRTRSPILAKNSLQDHRWNRKIAAESNILSHYVIPLTVQNEPIGVLQIDLSDDQKLVHGDKAVFQRKMQILNTFANQCAIAIRNIRQFMIIKNLETNIAETAHEFRSPLHNIMTQVGGLRESLELDENQESISQFVEVIEEEIYRAKRQVDNSLLLTEHTREAMEFNFREGRIQDIVHVCVDAYKLRALERGIRFIVPESVLHLKPFAFDHDRMKQAITNLIDNAVKYSHYHQFIHVSGNDDGTQINLEIADRGLGIPPDQFETIFEGFQRSDAKDEIRYIPGTGLGLKISKEIVERHGGRIAVMSDPYSRNPLKIEQLQDYKTVFRLTLPKKQKKR